MNEDGYDFGPERFDELLIARWYPEKADHETALLKDFLLAHLREFDHIRFSARVGVGTAPNPEHLPGIQRMTAFSTRNKIDMIGWKDGRATLVEAKKRVGHAVMGQLLTDRQLYLEEHPDEPEPALVAIGREGDDDALRVLVSHGITVYLYEAPAAE
jgi:hypothetical protein